MDLGLDGRVCLILGAAGGLGGAVATAFAVEGARVALADINTSGLDATAEQVSSVGNPHEPMTLDWDLLDLDEPERNIRKIEDSWGPVEVLVNITGGPPPSPITGLGANVWSDAFRSMVLPVLATTDRVLPGMRQAGWGRVITSTSSGVVAPIPGLGISNALRSTLMGWSKTLSSEEAPYGITVNTVVPGRISTSRVTSLDEQRAKREEVPVSEIQKSSRSSIPMDRYGEPAEYAAAISFLAGTPSSYITGSVMRVDGGYISSI